MKAKKYVYGIGLNDSEVPVTSRIKGKQVSDPVYAVWYSMLERCYSAKLHAKRPNYTDCTVDPDWLFYSVFREWMLEQEWEGKDLDKDIIEPGNKHYCPDACCFVTPQLNKLLNDHAAERGEWPIGVNFHKASGKFVAQINRNGKRVYIGVYTDPEQASAMYVMHKMPIIADAARNQGDPRVAAGLRQHMHALVSGAVTFE